MTPEQEANYRAALLRSRTEFPEIHERIVKERKQRRIERRDRKAQREDKR